MTSSERDDVKKIRLGALSGFAWMSVTKVVVQTFSWVGTIYVARILAPEDYGLMAVASIFTGFATMIVDMGLQRGLIQQKEISRAEYDVVFYIGLIASLIMYVILYSLAPAIGDFYDMPQIASIIQISAIAIVLASFQGVPRAKVMRNLDFKYRSIVEMLSAFLSTITVIILATKGHGVWSLVWGIIVMQLSSAIAYLPLYEWFPKFPMKIKKGKGVLVYGFKMATTDFMFYFYSQADIFIVGKMLGQQQVGFYSMAKQLASFPIDKLGSLFNHVAFPVFSRLQDNNEEATLMFIEIHKYLLLITMPLLIGLALVSEDLVNILLTEKWLPIVPVLQALSLVGILRISGMLVPPLMNSQGKVGFTMRYSLVSLFILPIAFYIGSHFGLEGVAISWCLSFPAIYIYLIILLRNTLRLPIKEFFKSSRSVYVASFLMAFSVSATKVYLDDSEIIIRLISCIFTGVISYLLVFLLLFPRQVDDIKKAFLMLKNKQLH